MNEAKKQTAQGRVTALLREAILSGRLRPNERLVETELAARFGVSRTPIRGAIRQLEEDGWIKTERNRGAIVVSLSPKEVKELFFVRAHLEAIAGVEACKQATEKDLAVLEAILREMEDCDPEDNIYLRQHNLRFHKELCALCRNGCLISLIEDLWTRSQFFRRSVWYPPTRWQQSIRDHRILIELLRKKDERGVHELLLRHTTYFIGLEDEVEEMYGRS